MAVRINSPVPLGNVSRSGGRSASKKAEEKGDAPSASGERVELSDKEAAISTVKQAARGVGDVDEVKVAELRAAIARGDYQADLRIVAERIIAEATIGRRGK